MRVRLTKVDEFQLLTCLKHQLWGSKSARFGEWAIGDKLIILSEKAVAAVAEVSGKPFASKERVWDNGLYPHRIAINFTHVLTPGHRPPVLGPIRNALTAEWGPRYGIGILNQRPLSNSAAEIILREFEGRPNDLSTIRENLSDLLVQAKLQREGKRQHKTRAGRAQKQATPPEIEREKPATKAEESAHVRAQEQLIRLGKITGCRVWVALNDRTRKYKGKALGDSCLRELPNLGFDTDTSKRVSLIDVIWIRQNSPLCAFEVETTTSVQGGLLRMSDLLAQVPALKMNLYIVAPEARQQKFMSELRRPTFQKIGLNEFCRFISTEQLELLLKQLADLEGHVSPTVVDKIAVELEEEVEAVGMM